MEIHNKTISTHIKSLNRTLYDALSASSYLSTWLHSFAHKIIVSDRWRNTRMTSMNPLLWNEEMLSVTICLETKQQNKNEILLNISRPYVCYLSISLEWKIQVELFFLLTSTVAFEEHIKLKMFYNFSVQLDI